MREFVSVHVSEQHPGLGTLLLTRTPSNTLSRQTCRELVSAADEISERDDIAAVIVFGGHDVFCTGDDLGELETLNRHEAEAADRVRREAIDAVASIPKPTVAAVTGYALGSGLGLALAADWRASGDNVKVGATEVLSGLLPGGGGCARLAASSAIRGRRNLPSAAASSMRRKRSRSAWSTSLPPRTTSSTRRPPGRPRFVRANRAALAGIKALINDDVSATEQQRRYGEVFAARKAVRLPFMTEILAPNPHATAEQVEAARHDTKLAQVLYHDWEAESL